MIRATRGIRAEIAQVDEEAIERTEVRDRPAHGKVHLRQ
jgi:hypothetical protein